VRLVLKVELAVQALPDQLERPEEQGALEVLVGRAVQVGREG
jgi:hypothetical protein